MKILIAPNSFKENISAVEITEILGNELSKSELCNQFELIKFPISDGGDGFLEVLERNAKFKKISFKVDYPFKSLGKNKVFVLYDEINHTVFIESAQIIGLQIVPSEKRNPLEITSKPIGELLMKIEESGLKVRKLFIGIGGTATQDLGLGMMEKLGVCFSNKNGERVNPIPQNFSKIFSINHENLKKLSYGIFPIADVTNPLLGQKGSNQTFAQQKGADNNSISELEIGFTNILKILNFQNNKYLSGAGGGIVASLQIFFKSKVMTSNEFILKILNLEKHKDSNFVITGEGQIDNQTENNKAPKIVRDYFADSAELIFQIAGNVKEEIKLTDKERVYAVNDFFNNLEDSKKFVREGLVKIAKLITRDIMEKLHGKSV